MKTQLIARVLLLSGLSVFGNAAMASHELAGALIGAGTGAVIGNSIDRHDGAIVGGIFGAILGAAIADNDRRPVVVRHYSEPVYVQPRYGYRNYRPEPVVVYQAPRVRYISTPVYVDHRPGYRHGYRDRDDRRDQRLDSERGSRHDGRDGRDGRRGG